MADGTGVGAIFLDLIVRNTVGKQVQNIAQQAQNTAKTAFSGMEKAAESMANSASATAAKAMQKTATSVSQGFNKSVAMAQARVRELEREYERISARAADVRWSYHYNEDGDSATNRMAERLALQQEAAYDRLIAARERLTITEQAAAQKAAVAAEKAAQRQQKAAEKEAIAAERAAERTARANERASAEAKKLSNYTAKSSAGMSGLAKSADGFGKRMSSIVSGALFFNIISSALSRLTSKLGETISSTTQMQSALSNLQGAAYTAASPLIGVLSNAFASLANTIAGALSYVTQLYSVLSGKSLSALSNTAKQMNKVSSAAGGTAKSADKAKRSLASFDEIQILQDNSADSAGGGGGGAIAPDYAYGLENGISPAVTGMADKIKQLIEPLRNIDFTPLKDSLSGLETSFMNLGSIISDSLEWAWFNILVPLSIWSIEDFAPVGIDLFTSALNLLSAALSPVWEGLKQLWDWMTPVFDFIGETAVVVLGVWSDAFDKLAGVFSEKGPEIQGIISGIGEIIAIVWAAIEPVLQSMRTGWEQTFSFIADICSEQLGYLIDFIYGAVEFIAGVLSGDWSRAWEGAQTVLRSSINSIIGLINGMISGIVSGVNSIIGALNQLRFTIPSWIPGYGGKSLGFNIGYVAAPQIPMLANGGVITQPTLAMMGEYAGASSNPEIAAPQSLIAETVADALKGVTIGDTAILSEILRALMDGNDLLQEILDKPDGALDINAVSRAVSVYQRREARAMGR